MAGRYKQQLLAVCPAGGQFQWRWDFPWPSPAVGTRSNEQQITSSSQPVRNECTQTHRNTKVKTVYPPVSLRLLGGYNNLHTVEYDKYNPLENNTMTCTSSHLCNIHHMVTLLINIHISWEWGVIGHFTHKYSCQMRVRCDWPTS